MPFTLIQGVGRADLTAKLHLAELPVYLPLLWWLISHAGIEGAAMTWALRSLFDMLLLFALSLRLLGDRWGLALRMGSLLGTAITLFVVAAVLPSNPGLLAAYVTSVLAGLLLATWFFLLSDVERQDVSRLVRRAPLPSVV
jgi:O-antigen/teichoic acid export membrane protein